MLTRLFSDRNDDINKRLVWLAEARDPNAGQETLESQQNEDPLAFAAEARRLDTEKIEDEAEDDLSVDHIIQRLQTIRDKRQRGDIDGLGRQILQWYGDRYAGIIAAAGNRVTNNVIDQIRDQELNRVRQLSIAQSQTELDEIRSRDIPIPPAFNVAFTQLTAGAGFLPSNLGQETRDLLVSMNIDAAEGNSATRYLEVTRQKAAAESELANRKAELNRLQGVLERNNKAKDRIQQQKEEWDRKKWSLVPKAIESIAKPALKLGATGAGLFGLGSGFSAAAEASAATAAAGAATGWAAVGSSLWSVASTIGSGIGSLFTFGTASAATWGAGGLLAWNYINPNHIRRTVSHWWSNERPTQGALHRQKRAVEEQQLVVDQAEATLEGYRKQNAQRVSQLRAKRKEWEQELKNPNITAVQRDQLRDGIARLNAVITLFRVSEGDHAQSISQAGAIDNDYIVRNLEAMGLREEGQSIYAELDQLVERQDIKHTKKVQQQLKAIATEGSIEKELPKLSPAEEAAVRTYFETPTATNAAAALAQPNLNRNAPRLHAAIGAMNALYDDNVWRVRMARAFLQSLDDRMSSVAMNSLSALLKKIERDDKDTAEGIRSNPRVILRYAADAGITAPTAPSIGEDFNSWIKRLSNTDLGYVVDVMDWLDERSSQLQQIDKNLDNIKDDEVRNLIMAQPACLRDVNPHLPDPAVFPAPAIRNFDEYKTRLDATQRALLADALLKVNAPHKYVRNPATDRLEYEYYRQVENVFMTFDQDSRDALNDPTTATVISHLRAASGALAFQTTESYAFLPDTPVGMPATAIAFLERIRLITDARNLKRVYNLIERMRRRRCSYDSASHNWRTR